jgi:hypothetical protein
MNTYKVLSVRPAFLGVRVYHCYSAVISRVKLVSLGADQGLVKVEN